MTMSAVYRGIGKIRDERSVHVFGSEQGTIKSDRGAIERDNSKWNNKFRIRM